MSKKKKWFNQETKQFEQKPEASVIPEDLSREREGTMSNEVASVAQNPAAPTKDTNAPVAGVVPALLTDPSARLVPVDMLDSDAFENSRGSFDEATVNNIQNSLRTEGQIQSILGTMLQSGKIGVVAGYTRTEAQWRNVCLPLINDYNKEKGLEDEHRLIVSNPKHRLLVAASYPEKFAKQKEKYPIAVRLDPDIKTAADARVRNVRENIERKDLTLLEQMLTFDKMITVDGKSAKDVAKLFRFTESYVSQVRKVNKLPAALREFLVTPDTIAGKVEEIAESDLVKLKEHVDLLVNELVHRMNILPKDETHGMLALGISHPREFAARVVVSDKAERAILRVHALEALCDLVGADPKSFKINAKKPPVFFGIFKNKLESFEEEAKKRRAGIEEEVSTVKSDDGAAAASTTPEADKVTGTVEGLAATQAAATAAAGPVLPVSGQDEASEENADVVVGAAEVDNKSVADKAAALVGGTAGIEDTDATEEEAEELVTGQKKGKTQQAEIESAKVKDASRIFSAIKSYMDGISAQSDLDAENVRLPLAATASSAYCIAFGYEMLSMDKDRKDWDERSVEYAEAVDSYVRELEDFVEKAAKKAKMKFTVERPVFNTVGLMVGGEDASVSTGEPTDADLEGIDDEEDLSDEALAELEDLVGDDDMEDE